MTQTVTIAGCPSQVQGTGNLRIYAKDQFCPVLRTLFVGHTIRRIPFPHRVRESLPADIHLITGIAIAQASIDTVGCMLILHDIEVHTQAKIRGAGLIRDTRHLIVLMVCPSHAHLQDGKILVVQVHTQRSLILAIVTQLHLRQSHEVCRYGKATEERHRVALKFQESLSGRRKKRQVERQDDNKPPLTS